MLIRYFIFIVLIFSFLFGFELQKPKIYQEYHNIDGWIMSEKLDGIRGYWDGKNLYTKNGNQINVPKNFTENFPPFELDGELWSKRDDFENIQSIVLDKKPSNNWNQIAYNIFESPNSKGNFLQRIKRIENWFLKYPNQNVRIIKQIKCENEIHLNKFLKQIVLLKGEGVIIKDGSKPYKEGRLSHVLKVKESYDMEGVVIGYNYRNKSKIVKSLIIKLPNEVIFNLGGGFTNKQRLNPPKIGDIVTFKYYGFTKYGKPKFASFLRVRKF